MNKTQGKKLTKNDTKEREFVIDKRLMSLIFKEILEIKK